MAKRTSRRGFRKKSKQYSKKYSKKYSRKKSRKYTRKTYRKKHKRSKNNRKNVKKNLVGGALNLKSVISEILDSYPQSVKKPTESIIRDYYDLLVRGDGTNIWYGSEENILSFLKHKLSATVPNNNKLASENLKEVRIATFTNFYRKSIYKLVYIIDDYLGGLADVVLSGGDGLNNNLFKNDRLVSPDVDVKVIIKHSSVNTDNWLNVYRLVVVMTEYIVDYIICCMNNTLETFIYIPALKAIDKTMGKVLAEVKASAPGTTVSPIDFLQGLFYGGDTFDISKHEGFSSLLPIKNVKDLNLKLGNIWNRRTSNMKAGGKKTPFTLMNVKLIAIDLRYFSPYIDGNFFGSLAGVLDIVVGVPGHIGHNKMLNTDLSALGYYPREDKVYCINKDYYIYEMVKMISAGLRTNNGKLYKDLGRCYTLLLIKNITIGQVKPLIKVSIEHIKSPNFPIDLITVAEGLLNKIQFKIDEEEKGLIDVAEKTLIIEHIKLALIDPLIKEYESMSCSCDTIESGPVLRSDYDTDQDIYTDPQSDKSQQNPDSEEATRFDPGLDSALDSFVLDGEESEGDVKPFTADIIDMSGGGFSDENTDSIGKVLESLNIYDFLKQHDRVETSAGGEVYIKINCCITDKILKIKINEHDKLVPGIPNFPNGIDLSLTEQDEGRRIDYEKLSFDNASKETELLCREKNIVYSFDGLSMSVYEENTEPYMVDMKNKAGVKALLFNTSLVLICHYNAKILADILTTLIKCLIEKPDTIKYLAQFRYFINQEMPEEFQSGEPELYAIFLFSSVIKGLNPIKLLRQKKTIRQHVLGINDTVISGLKNEAVLVKIQELVVNFKITQTKNSNLVSNQGSKKSLFTILVLKLVEFYNLIGCLATREDSAIIHPELFR